MATASQMIKEAYSLVGQPYLWGGNGETLEEIIRKYADGKGQGKSATDDMIKFLKGIIPVGLDTHFQDCSGMVIEILRKLGVIDNKYDATAEGLWKTCKKIDKPCEGAWAFYFDGKKHNHIGICVNNLTVIHCLYQDWCYCRADRKTERKVGKLWTAYCFHRFFIRYCHIERRCVGI